MDGVEVKPLRGRGIKNVPYFPGRRVEIHMLHFHDKIKNGTAATMGKTVEEISFKVHMKGIWIIAVVDGATSTKTV
jgi:hypothetical protein